MTLRSCRSSIRLVLSLGLVVLVFTSCASSRRTANTLTDDATSMESAQHDYDRGDYRGAVRELTSFLAESPGSKYADQATMLLGQAYYEAGDYFAAEERFRRIKRDFPESKMAEEASYYLGLALLSQSRRPELDQAETEEALVEFQSFIRRYPDNPNVERARGHMRDARTKLAEKQYKNGITYSKTKSYAASQHHFEQVVTLFPETEWVCPAMYRLIRSFEKTRDWNNVALWCQRMMDEQPDCEYLDDAQKMLARSREELVGYAPLETSVPDPRAADSSSAASTAPDGID